MVVNDVVLLLLSERERESLASIIAHLTMLHTMQLAISNVWHEISCVHVSVFGEYVFEYVLGFPEYVFGNTGLE